MPKNPKQNEGIESRHDVREDETNEDAGVKNKRKGLNSGTMPENLKQNEGIESGHDIGEPKTKQRDRIRARCRRT